jgi:molecular chaperone GrpE
MPEPDKPDQSVASGKEKDLSQQAQPAEGTAFETSEEGPIEPDIAALQQELAESAKQSQYHLEQWKRSAANLANYRKHVEKERVDLIKSAKANVVVQLLPVLDDLERAFDTIPFALSSFTWTEGLALIDRKLELILEQQGLEEIKALGEPFDPTRHQALLEEETEEYPDGHVMAILQKGYTLDDRILRPALVKIARNAVTGEGPGSAKNQKQAEEQGTGKGAESVAADSLELN